MRPTSHIAKATLMWLCQRLSRLAASGILLTPSALMAQNVIPTNMEGQPLMYMKDGAVNGCGLRIIGGNPSQTSAIVNMFDVSINVYRSEGAMVKIVSYSTTVAELQTNKPPKTIKVKSGWLKTPGEKATDPGVNPAVSGDDPNSILYRTSIDSAISIFTAYARQQPISVGIFRAADTSERVYYGRINMSSQEMEQHRSCIQELSR